MNAKNVVFVPMATDGYELCHPSRPEDFETINVEVNGVPRGESWKPIPMQLIHEDEGQMLAPSSRVLEALGSVLRANGELLPLDCSEAELVIYNPTQLIDALDEAVSSMLRFGDGRIMMIQRYVFRPDVVTNVDIFKIPNLRVSPTFLSHRFVQEWNRSGLSGLDFKEVWSA